MYFDILQNRFAQNGEPMLRAAEAWHSLGTEAELAAAIGLLNPAHRKTRELREQISSVIERRPRYRTIAPDPEVWRDAGILSGVLARLQGYSRDHRRRALNDALLFATARKHGCTVLTRNVIDFDMLARLDPSPSVSSTAQRLCSGHLNSNLFGPSVIHSPLRHTIARLSSCSTAPVHCQMQSKRHEEISSP